MARPEKEDRSTVANETLTLRLTEAELSGLRKLVTLKQAELSKSFPGVTLSLASLVRGFIQRELAALSPASEPAEQPASPAQPVEDSRQPFLPTVTPEVVPVTPECVSESKRVTVTKREARKQTLPERLQAVKDSNLRSFRQIGIDLGMKEGSAVGKWCSGERSIPSQYEAQLDEILRTLGV